MTFTVNILFCDCVAVFKNAYPMDRTTDPDIVMPDAGYKPSVACPTSYWGTAGKKHRHCASV